MFKNIRLVLIPLLLCSFLSSEVNAQDSGVKTEVINEGIGGNSTKDLLRRVQTDVIDLNPDLVILMVGTNDMLNPCRLGSYEGYIARLDSLVKLIKSAGSEVLVMSPPPADSTYLFQRHDRNLYSQAPNEIMDSLSYIVEHVAQDNNALFLNLFAEFTALNIPRHNIDLFIQNKRNCNKDDGVHPTPLGYHFIAQNIYQYLKDKNLLSNYSKIICFGDSITNGSSAKGGDKLTGQNYPSFLYRLLNPVY